MKIFIRFFLLTGFMIQISASSGQREAPVLPINSTTGKITYKGGIYVDNKTKQELFDRAIEWLTKTYKSSKSVIQLEDRESGKIIGKELMQVNYQGSPGRTLQGGYINYTITIYLADGRYSYEITNFYHTGQYNGSAWVPDYGVCEKMINTTDRTPGTPMQKIYDQFLNQLDNNMRGLVEDLRLSMTKKAANDKKDN